MGEWTDLIKLTVALLAIVDPVASIPVFLSTTTGYTQAERRRVTQVVAISLFIAGSVLFGSGKYANRSNSPVRKERNPL